MNWQSIGEVALSVLILASAIPITYLIIKGINRFERSNAAKRFDAWWDKSRLERERKAREAQHGEKVVSTEYAVAWNDSPHTIKEEPAPPKRRWYTIKGKKKK